MHSESGSVASKDDETRAHSPTPGAEFDSPPGAVFVSSEALPWETTAEFGALKWKTIFGGPFGRPGSEATLTQGICVITPKTTARRHHHAQEESVYVISGSALVSTGYNGVYEEPKRVSKGDSVWYPSNCSHRTVNDTDEDFVCLYTFPKAAKFDHVVYCYDE